MIDPVQFGDVVEVGAAGGALAQQRVHRDPFAFHGTQSQSQLSQSQSQLLSSQSPAAPARQLNLSLDE